jgi:hypothetical protein
MRAEKVEVLPVAEVAQQQHAYRVVAHAPRRRPDAARKVEAHHPGAGPDAPLGKVLPQLHERTVDVGRSDAA